MEFRWEINAAIAAERILAVVRADSGEAALQAGQTLIDAGIRVVEVALTTPDGLDAVRKLARPGREPPGDGRIIGAGTVLDATSARLATLAGARFLVSPSASPEVIEAGHRHGVSVMPGTQTPTEIESALAAGADMIKLFPASSVGPEYLQAVRAALPQAPIVPTGGISVDNAAEWLAAGAVTVGVGGSLVSGDPGAMEQRAHELLRAVRSAR